MARKATKGPQLQKFILSEMKQMYEEKISDTVDKQSAALSFKHKEAIVDFVLESDYFYDNDAKETDVDLSLKIKNGAIGVSRGTVRKAVNTLIEENLIRKENNEYVWIPHTPVNEKYYPILSAAPHIDITINIPETVLILSMPHEFTASVAAYLSALFHKGDILFIPVSNFIVCIGVLPDAVLCEKRRTEIPPKEFMKYRIERALYNFNVKYPQFLYGGQYEIAHTSLHDPLTRSVLHEIANNSVETESSYITGETRTPTERFADLQALFSHASQVEDLLARDAVTDGKAREQHTRRSGARQESDTENSEEDDIEKDEYDAADENVLTEEMREMIDVFFDPDFDDGLEFADYD